MLIGVDEKRGRHLLSTTDRSNSGRGEFQEASGLILYNTEEIRNVSKVVDENGEPLVVHHGTAKDFSVFDASRTGESTGNTGFYGAGFYFSQDHEYASGYASWARRTDDDAANLVPAYLSMKNPLYIHVNPQTG